MSHESRLPAYWTPLGAYFLLAYALTWVFTIPFVYVWHNVTDKHFAWWMILFLPGAYGPTLAAIIVTAMTEGRAGVRTLLGKFCQWRAPVGWWLFVAAAPLAMVFVAIVVSGFGSQAAASLDLRRAPLVVVVSLLVALPFGPLPEEPGWRGYALPSLLARRGILASSLVVGFFWTFWHPPMFWFPGAAIPSCLELSAASVFTFLLLLCAESVTFAVVYLHTRGSVPVAITLHLFGNAAANIAYGLTTEPTVDEARRVYFATVVLHCVVAVAMLGYNALVPAARDGTIAG